MAKTTTKSTTPKGIVYYATGRRKTSTARVFMKPGTGVVTVNALPIEKYLPTEVTLVKALLPLTLTDSKGKYDAEVTVSGGGKSGQAGAICHGITRALLVVDGEKLRPMLKKAGLVTRDSRMVERKKYGLHKARKKGQYSKR